MLLVVGSANKVGSDALKSSLFLLSGADKMPAHRRAPPYSATTSFLRSLRTFSSNGCLVFHNNSNVTFHTPFSPPRILFYISQGSKKNRLSLKIPSDIIPLLQNPVLKLPFSTKSRRYKIPFPQNPITQNNALKDTFCVFHIYRFQYFFLFFVPTGILCDGILRPSGFCAKGF